VYTAFNSRTVSFFQGENFEIDGIVVVQCNIGETQDLISEHAPRCKVAGFPGKLDFGARTSK